jgi:hypothetical protein
MGLRSDDDHGQYFASSMFAFTELTPFRIVCPKCGEHAAKNDPKEMHAWFRAHRLHAEAP